jgi:predicted RNase H-like HicB family nuclease
LTNLFAITVHFNDANATPIRDWDWVAYVAGQEENPELYAYGATKEEALEQLGFAIVEHVDDHIYDLAEQHKISQETADECFVDIDGLTYLPY